MLQRAVEGPGRDWQQTWNWRDCQEALPVGRRTQPERPFTGQTWHDRESGCLYLWNGSQWVCISAD